MKRCLAPVYPSPLSPHTAAPMQRCLRIPSLSDCCCRLMTINKWHCSAAGCLKSIYLTSQTAISIQASTQQFQLGFINQLEKKKKGIFNITCKLHHSAHAEKSDTSRYCQMCWTGTSQHMCSWLNTSGARFPVFTLSKACSWKYGSPRDAEVLVWQLKSWHRKQKTYIIKDKD